VTSGLQSDAGVAGSTNGVMDQGTTDSLPPDIPPGSKPSSIDKVGQKAGSRGSILFYLVGRGL